MGFQRGPSCQRMDLPLSEVSIFRVGLLRDQKTNHGFELHSVMLHKQGEVWPDVSPEWFSGKQSCIINNRDSLDGSRVFFLSE